MILHIFVVYVPLVGASTIFANGITDAHEDDDACPAYHTREIFQRHRFHDKSLGVDTHGDHDGDENGT